MTALEPGITIDAYQRFNLQADQGVLVWQWSHRGFGSELLTMLLAMVYAVEHGLQFQLCSRYSNLTSRRGWADYFQPFCPEVTNPLYIRSHLRKPNTLVARLFAAAARMPGIRPTTKRLALTHEVFPLTWNAAFTERRVRIPALGVDAPVTELCIALLKAIWQLQHTARTSIDHLLNPLQLDGVPYAAIHVRRGDKLKNEAVEVPLERYIEAIQIQLPDVRRVFIATDSFNVVKEFQARWPEYDWMTLSDPSQQGHLQRAFNRQSHQEKYRQTIALLADITALQRCDCFVGTFSSNLGRVIALFKGLQHTHGVDGPFRLV